LKLKLPFSSVVPDFPEVAANATPETGESTKMPVAGPVGMFLLTALTADAEDELEEVSSAFSPPPSQAARPTTNTVDNTGIHEFFPDCCLDFIKMLSF
jgi:hypothetical protein